MSVAKITDSINAKLDGIGAGDDEDDVSLQQGDEGQQQGQDEGQEDGDWSDEDLGQQPQQKAPAQEKQPQQQQGKKPNEQQNNQQRQPQQPERPDPSTFRQLRSGQTIDGKGNIVDPRTGHIIARAGNERRLYESGMRMREGLQDRDTTITELRRELNDIKFLNDVPRQYGITNDELTQMFDIGITFKRNAVEGARKVVEMALALGHNVTDILGADAGNAIDLKAVQRMIADNLKPLRDAHQQTQERSKEQQALEKQQQQFNDWLDSREYAEVHIEALDNLARKGYTPDQAYYELRDFARRNGLNFSKPLLPQIEARRTRNGGNNGRQQQQSYDNTRRRVSTPYPGNGSGNEVAHQDAEDMPLASPNDSWDNIIKTAMVNARQMRN